jgi:hypothetical protein
MEQLTPSPAARAASVLHHTWGIDGHHAAAAIYPRIMECETPEQLQEVLEDVGSGIWAQVEDLSLQDLQENIQCLAQSIDECIKTVV